jgi:hypothetical protein
VYVLEREKKKNRSKVKVRVKLEKEEKRNSDQDKSYQENQQLDKPQWIENSMMQTTIQRKRERLFVGCRYIKKSILPK